jgi:hypothetical protein
MLCFLMLNCFRHDGVLYPGVPRVAGYDPKNLDMAGSFRWQMIGEPSTPYYIWSHHSWLKRRATNLKRMRLGNSLY